MAATLQKIFHIPVLVNESLTFLLTNLHGVYVDATLGGGGHSEAILKLLSKKGVLIGIDRDTEAVEFCRDRFSSYGEQVRIIKGDFGNIDQLLTNINISSINGLLLDLGVSSHQIDTAIRGFSYTLDGTLDMRMNSTSSISAKKVINEYPEHVLAEIFRQYGEERFARRIAHRIVEERKKLPIETTGELAEVVRRVIPSRWQIKTLSRIWQAIRIEVNDELEQLRMGLDKVFPLLNKGGRIVVICYHSLEDRIVKRFFRGETETFSRQQLALSSTGYRFQVLTRRVVRPSDREIRLNSRARSARLRAAEKI